MEQGLTSRERWTGIAIKVWALIGVLLLVAAAGWLLSRVSSALAPFGIGLIVVLLLRKPVDALSLRTNRTVAVLVCYLAAFLALGALLTFILPPVIAQVTDLLGALPGYTSQAFDLWDTWVMHPAAGAGVPTWLQDAVLSLKDEIIAGAGSWSSAIAAIAVSAGSSIANGVIGFILALIIGFYTLVDLKRMKTEVFTIAGEGAREELSHAFATITRVLAGWMKGTLMLSTVVGTLMGLGFWAAGVPYALALGVIGGVFNIVPYVGPALTGVLAVIAGLFGVTPWVAVWAFIVVFAVQQIDSLFLSPRIMSGQVDLHPLLIIFSLLVGSALFGVTGMVLSVPVSAIVKGLFVYWFEKRTERQLTTEDGVLFPTPVKDADSIES